MARMVAIFLFLYAGSAYSVSERVYLIKVKASINPGTGDYIISAIKKANTDSAKLLIIELDTPGGLVDTTRLIVQEMLSSKVPIAVNVTPSGAHAGSAGVMITMAANVAAMAPGTNIGAAHPVGMEELSGKKGKKDEEGKDKNVMGEKIVNDISAFVEGIAKMRNRNVGWAIDAVKNSASITSDNALKKGVIDYVVNDTRELIGKLEGKYITKKENVELVNISMNTKQSLVSFFADPNIAYFLMMLAALGIYIELSHPGLFLPGFIGVFAALLAMISFQMLPITTGGLIFLIGGLILIAVEFFVPGLGFWAVGGSISIVIGGLFLINPVKMDVSISKSLIFSTGITFAVMVLIVSYLVLKIRSRKVIVGFDEMKGKIAEIISYDEESQTGKLSINSEIWDFKKTNSLKQYTVGDRVVIVEKDGLTLIVD